MTYYFQSVAASVVRRAIHHEYTCLECSLCPECLEASDNPMLLHDSRLFLCERCELCDKSTALSEPELTL